MKRSIVLLALFAAACSKSSTAPSLTTPPVATVTLTSVALSAAFASLKQPGQSTPIIATGTFSNGTTSVVTPSCTNWQSDNTAVLTVDGGGVMTARASGGATVTTTCQGVFARGLATLALIPAQVFSVSGSGDTVFDMPTYVTRIRVTARYTGNSSNFIVKVATRLLVNELLGTFWNMTTFDGTYVTTGGVTEITNSSGVAWTFTEVR